MRCDLASTDSRLGRGRLVKRLVCPTSTFGRALKWGALYAGGGALAHLTFQRLRRVRRLSRLQRYTLSMSVALPLLVSERLLSQIFESRGSSGHPPLSSKDLKSASSTEGYESDDEVAHLDAHDLAQRVGKLQKGLNQMEKALRGGDRTALRATCREIERLKAKNKEKNLELKLVTKQLEEVQFNSERDRCVAAERYATQLDKKQTAHERQLSELYRKSEELEVEANTKIGACLLAMKYLRKINKASNERSLQLTKLLEEGGASLPEQENPLSQAEEAEFKELISFIYRSS